MRAETRDNEEATRVLTSMTMTSVHSEDARPMIQHSRSNKKRALDGIRSTSRLAPHKKRLKTDRERTIDDDLGINRAIALMDNSLMVDYIARRTKRFRPDLSVVESDDISIPGEDLSVHN